MEFLQDLLYNLTGNQQVVSLLIYLVAAVAGITLAMAIYYLVSGAYSPVRQQIGRMVNSDEQQDSKRIDYRKMLESNLEKVGNLPALQASMAKDKDSKKLLIHAGFHSENALQIYYAIRLTSVLLGASAGLLVVNSFPDLSAMWSFYCFALLLGGSYLLPATILTKMANRRMSYLRRFFPDALDLLVVCSEAGLGLLEAFQRVSRELQVAHPQLSSEIGLVCSKVRVGISIQQALNEFSDRTGLEDIRGLNSVLVQSLRLGTGIAETIRVYADEYRDKRLQQAEENAAKLGVKLIFPTMVCIWPSFFIVAIGPAMLKVMNIWSKAF